MTLLEDDITCPASAAVGVVVADRIRRDTATRGDITDRVRWAGSITLTLHAHADLGLTVRPRTRAVAVTPAGSAGLVRATDHTLGAVSGRLALRTSPGGSEADRAVVGAGGALPAPAAPAHLFITDQPPGARLLPAAEPAHARAVLADARPTIAVLDALDARLRREMTAPVLRAVLVEQADPAAPRIVVAVIAEALLVGET